MSLDVTLCRSLTCPVCGEKIESGEKVFSANITHNLNKMAEAAGIYMELWRPDEIGIDRAHQLISPLKKGYLLLAQNPEYFSKFNSSNGWGTYNSFMPWLKQYIDACREHPDAFVRANR